MNLGRLGLVVIAITTLFAPATAQRERFCSPCKGTGYIPCDKRKCEKQKCLFEGEHTCLEQMELECCMGIRKHPCTICKSRINDHELEKKRRDEWVKSLKQERKDLVIPTMVRVRTDSFELNWDVDRIRVGRRYYDRNDGAHIYAGRLEELLEEYKKWFGEPYRYPQGPWVVYVTDDGRDVARVSQTLSGGRATKVFGPKPFYVTSGGGNDDEFRHADIVHHVSHHLAQQGYHYGEGRYPGWWTVGVARFMEIEKWGETRHSCVGEVTSKELEQWQHGKWHGRIYSRVNRDKAMKLASFVKKGLKQMNYMEHAYAWSYVDFVAKAHPDKVTRVAHGLTSGRPTSRVLREVLGMSLAQFHEAWASWVRKSYAGKR